MKKSVNCFADWTNIMRTLSRNDLGPALETREAWSGIAHIYQAMTEFYFWQEVRRCASVEWCRERRIPKLELQVYNANIAALRAYKALGFQEYLTKMELRVEA